MDRGADVNLQNQHGASPLLEAIARNRNSMILKLLQSPFIDAAIVDLEQHSILHVAAASANTLTLQVLSTFKLEGIDIHARRYDGLTALDVAEKRQKEQNDQDDPDELINEKWVAAFRTLLEQAVQTARGPPPPYKPFKDEEDRFTDYSRTESPTSSIYHDAKSYLNLKINVGRPSSLVGSLTGSPLVSRPSTPLLRGPPDPST